MYVSYIIWYPLGWDIISPDKKEIECIIQLQKDSPIG